MSQDAIIIDVALDAPPMLVWRALTEPELLARWLAPNDIEARIGRRFSVQANAGAPPVYCEVIEVEPDRLLSYRWREGGEGRQAALDTVVTWVLDPTPDGGTRLRLVHDGFPVTLRRQQPMLERKTMRAATRLHAARFRLRGDGRKEKAIRTHATRSQGSLKWAA